ncbi:PKD domain-containing protein, partial [Candidatus Amoebophilus asiaticus]|nr:PKD domain-containing protein [Candidatus Amoebophilus asiaticus]
GDGSGLFTGQNVTHNFYNAGDYNVCLEIADAKACTSYYCEWIYVGGNLGNCNINYTFIPDSVGNGVQFNAYPSTNITDGFWDFGDGTNSNIQDPYHVFQNAGYYNVCVTGFDSIGGCSHTFCDWVPAGDSALATNCAADFGFMINFTKDTVDFTDYSMGNITDWYWDFGDGMISNLQNPIHYYPTPGFYNVCLSVHDANNGCSHTFCIAIDLTDTNSVACYADFNFYPDSNNLVHFNNVSQGIFTDVHWDFGDGNYSNMWSPSHQYAQPGYYYVCLDLFDSISNCYANYCAPVSIIDTNFIACYADFTFFPDSNFLVHFNNQSMGNVTDVHWDFGDGSFSGLWNPDHQYSAPGFYNVCLSVFDSVSYCQNFFCMGVDVIDPNDTNFIACFPEFGFFPDSFNLVHFINYSQGTFSDAHWDFGDGNYSSMFSPSHQYAAPGFYNVCLTIFDSLTNCMGTVCKNVDVFDPNDTLFYGCIADFMHYPGGGANTVHFYDQSIGSFSNWYWDFGDGTTSSAPNPIHTYPGPGYYYPCLTVFDSLGCMDYHCDMIVLFDSTSYNCFANFTYYPDTNGQTVYFTDGSAGNFTNYHWEFGDGITSSDVNPVHVYPGPGYYTVCLTVFDSLSGCMDAWCEYIQIGANNGSNYDCNAFYTFFPDSMNDVHFSNASTGSYSHIFWEFGDGGTSIANNPVHHYDSAGYYSVCLTVFDSLSACINTYCDMIQIGIDTNNIQYCYAMYSYFPDANGAVHFSNISQGAYTNVHWAFGDGAVSNIDNPIHMYPGSGYYNACLTVFDSLSGCMNTYCDIIQIYDSTSYSCDAFYYTYPDSGTNTVYFIDQSFGNPVGWYWDFGNGSIADTTQNPSYTYANAGIYDVCLTIWNSNGCQATYCNVIEVNGGGNDCFAEFTYYADSVTATAYFQNTSLGYNSDYEWDFGDSLSVPSYQKNPSHTYPGIGVYPVCLTVTNDSGCVSIFCAYVNIGNDLQDKCEFSCAWPGDANNDLEANHYDLLTIGLNFGETGPARDSVSNRWIGHYCQDWSTFQQNGVNNKHGDCNGDGIIDLDDTLAVIQNFAYSHPFQNKTSNPNPANPDLYFEVVTPNVAPGTDVEVSIKAGRDNAIVMYGVGFEVELDGYIVNMSSVEMKYDSSWLGTDGVDMLTLDITDSDTSLGKVYGSLVRNDQNNTTGFGEIARLFFTINSDITNVDELLITLTTNGGGVLASGDSVVFNSGNSDTISINGVPKSTIEIGSFKLYPNPSNGNVTLDLPIVNDEYHISLYSIIGEEVYSFEYLSGGKIELDMNDLPNGVYVVHVTTSKMIYQQKLQLIR